MRMAVLPEVSKPKPLIVLAVAGVQAPPAGLVVQVSV